MSETSTVAKKGIFHSRDELHDVASGGLAALADQALVAVKHRHACRCPDLSEFTNHE